ncbi:hypothetical protein BELL_0070g00260 [Botrytis elliptica]|uniref:Uncharacterized protein n=1 Tax=Botrytis elliptica TaxID=278938 RepID=A0A4Z1JWR9_9HELO|nr:hypothetical protein EAE99_010505 [Botrytis elliptica]TGO78341.1 hypothetical protein BELL_0070g00260 [Botrytis elliptica]
MRVYKATGQDVEARSDHDIGDGIAVTLQFILWWLIFRVRSNLSWKYDIVVRSMTCNATTAAFLRAEDQDLSQVYKRAEDEDLSQVYKRAEDEDLSQVY